MTRKYLDDLTYQVIGAAIEVHKELGPGLLESVYEKCMIFELQLRGIEVKSQEKIPIFYKGHDLDSELRYDLLVENCILVELKSVEELMPIFQAQLLSHMKLMKIAKGVLINFNCTNIFKDGQKTLVNKLYRPLPPE